MLEEGAPVRGLDLERLIDEALVSNEPVRKPKAEKLRPQGLLERIILSRWTPAVYGALAGALCVLPVITLKSEFLDLETKIIMGAVSSATSYIAAQYVRMNWLQRKAEAAHRKFSSTASKIVNAVLSYPELAALPTLVAAGAYSSQILTVLPFSEILENPVFINLNLSLLSYVAFTALSAVYIAASAVFGAILHPEAIKTVSKALSATRNAYKAKYEEAAKDLTELLELPREYNAAIALQTAIGYMKMLSGDSAAIETHISALATQKTSYSGRNDDVLHLFLRVINRAADRAEKPDWAKAKDVQSVIRAAKALSRGKVKEADQILLSAVTMHRKSLTAHMARASFLRVTGQHRTADLEMRVCAELVMLDPNAKMERVEGPSRNLVYFSGNVAMKLNEDPAPLEGERSIVEMFRKRFGSSVIYPLPVYRRGDSYTLLSERGPETLLDLIKQRKARLEDFVQALELMVPMQHFGLERYNAGELKLNDATLHIKQSDRETLYFVRRRLQAIENIEQFNGVQMPQSYKDALGFGLSFVDLELAQSQLLAMCKDFGPKNVLKKLFGMMQVLDFEPQSLRLLPPQMDFINLTESMPYLSKKQLSWLQDVHFRLQQKATGWLDRQRFEITQAFSGLRWNYERLIYSTREAYAAKTPEQREEKKKDQVWHLIMAREHLDELIEKNYVSGEQLQTALRAREELKRPIFPEPEEQRRLEKIVEEERNKPLEQEPSPAGFGRIAAASVGIPALLFASLFGAVVVRNNFIPLLNVPLTSQGEKVLLTTQQATGIDYFVINAKTDEISFLTPADNLNASMSKFSDKAVLLIDGKVTLYDFVKREFRTAQNAGLTNPVLSPNGVWIAAEIGGSDTQPYTNRLRRIRPSDMKDFSLIKFGDSALHGPGKVWSPDSRYLLFFLGSNPTEKQGESWVEIGVLDILEMEAYEGPAVSAYGKHAAAWSANGVLAYSEEDGAAVYLSGHNLENPKKVYEAGRRDMLGYENETVEDIKFVSDTYLAIISALSGGVQQEVKRVASLLNMETKQLVTLDGSLLLGTSNSEGGKVLYVCNKPFDICEFDTNTGLSRNITTTPGLSEILAVSAQDGKKVYAIAYPVDCGQLMCAPSLFVIDPVSGKSKLLKQGEAGARYGLIAPPP